MRSVPNTQLRAIEFNFLYLIKPGMLIHVSKSSTHQPGLHETLVWNRVQFSVGSCGG